MTDTLGERNPFSWLRVGHENCEFVSSESSHEIRGSTLVEKACPDGSQDLVTDKVTVGIVHRLEMVDVDHEHAERVTTPLKPGNFLSQSLVEDPVDRATGETIGRRQLCNPLHQE